MGISQEKRNSESVSDFLKGLWVTNMQIVSHGEVGPAPTFKAVKWKQGDIQLSGDL